MWRLGSLVAVMLLAPAAIALPFAPGPSPGLVSVGLRDGVELPAPGDVTWGAPVALAIPQLGVVVLDAADAPAAAALASADPRVAWAEIDDPAAGRAAGAPGVAAPSDPLWSSQWGPQRIDVESAWAVTTGSEDVIVAVLDSGLDFGHEDFAGVKILPGINTWNPLQPSFDVTDNCGHGTHVTGTIAAATSNAKGVAGLAKVAILPVKIIEQTPSWCEGGYLAWAMGVVYAVDSGARVLSMSVGGTASSPILKAAMDYADARGALVVAASMNAGCVSPTFGCVWYPAAYATVMAVGCTTPADVRCSFSNGDLSLDIAAPGLAVWSTVPWGYDAWSGTSMATPHVSGVAGLMASVAPSAPGSQLKKWLEQTAEDLGPPGFDVEFGHGLLDAEKAVKKAAGL